MSVEIKVCGETVTAYLSGELDHHSAKEMREAIDNAVELNMPSRLVLNFKDISFMDSSGIGLVMGRYQNVKRKNGTMVVVPGSQYVSRVLGLSGIFSMVPKSRTRGLAIEYISGKGGERS